jgi:hypothetical protein
MTGGITLRERPDLTGNEWDQIVRPYAAATVFHLSCWHDVLNDSQPGKLVRFDVELDGRVCGHWCGLVLTRFGTRVFGAPLPGSATDYMYPLFSTPPPAGQFLDAVLAWAKHRGIALLEVGGAYFSEAELASKGYEIHQTRSYRVDLSAGESGVWKNLKPAMRNKVRKAEKQGITVTEDTPPDFPSLFFDMLRQVFLRQASVPTYSLGLIDTVVRVLSQSGNLKTLTAWHNGAALSSLILLTDDKAAYFWGGASYETAFPVGANDLIHWHALRFATRRGLLVYDTCGGGNYKEKFGGPLIHFPAGHLAVNPLFGIVRSAVKRGVRARQLVLGRLQTLRQRSS